MRTENNKIIAEFMNWSDTGNKGIQWNWLMEVVEKIEQTTIKETYGQFNEKESIAIVSVVIENKFCQILSNGIYLNEIISENKETKIEAVYNACIEFIKWYNEQNKV